MTSAVIALAAFALGLGLTYVYKLYFGQFCVAVECVQASHTGNRPTGAGLAFVAAWCVSLVFATQLGETPFRLAGGGLFFMMLPLAAVSYLDDIRSLAIVPRLIVQFAVVSGLLYLYGMPFPIAHPVLLPVSAFLLMLAMVGGINFFNFMDGVDGILGSSVCIQLLFIGLWLEVPALWILACCVAGFLVWNRPPYRVFMGDVGSTALGFIVLGSFISYSDYVNFSYFFILIPLLGDAGYTFIRRLLAGKNVLRAHRSHVYQRFDRAGWSHMRITSMYASATLMAGILISIGGIWGGVLLVLLWGLWLFWAESLLSRSEMGLPEAF